MTNERITAWITKRIFTEGIVKVEGTVYDVGGGKRKFAYTYNGQPRELWKEGFYWHLTYASAVAHARRERDKQLHQLRHNIRRFETMDWPDTETQHVVVSPQCKADDDESEEVRLLTNKMVPEIECIVRRYLRHNKVMMTLR